MSRLAGGQPFDSLSRLPLLAGLKGSQSDNTVFDPLLPCFFGGGFLKNRSDTWVLLPRRDRRTPFWAANFELLLWVPNPPAAAQRRTRNAEARAVLSVGGKCVAEKAITVQLRVE